MKHCRSLDAAIWSAARLDTLVALLVRYRAWLAYLVLLSVVAYGAELFTFSLTIDDENHAQSEGAKLVWASQGRWGMFVLSWVLLPDPVTAFIPVAVALLSSAMGFGLLLRAFGRDFSGIAPWLAAPLAIACPTLFYCYAFTTLGYGVGVGFLATAAGFYLFAVREGWRRLLGVPLLGLAVAVYQPFLLVMAVAFAFFLLGRILSPRERLGGVREALQLVLWFAALLLLSGAFYYGVQQGFYRWGGVSPDPYLQGFVKFQPTAAYLLPATKGAWNAALQYYGGGIEHYAYPLWSLRLLVITCLLVILLRIMAAPVSWCLRLLGVACLVLAVATPFLMHLMNGGFMPARVMLAFPLALAGLAYTAARTSVRSVQLLLVVLVVACSFNFAVVNNRFAFSNHMAWQADRELSTLLLDRIYALPLPAKSPHQAWTLELVGNRDFLPSAIFVKRNTIGSSFYGWANGDVRRTVALYKTMGVHDFRAATASEKHAVAVQAIDMPEWPRDGSVALVDGVIVVKLGRYTPTQRTAICAGKPADDAVCERLRTAPR